MRKVKKAELFVPGIYPITFSVFLRIRRIIFLLIEAIQFFLFLAPGPKAFRNRELRAPQTFTFFTTPYAIIYFLVFAVLSNLYSISADAFPSFFATFFLTHASSVLAAVFAKPSPTISAVFFPVGFMVFIDAYPTAFAFRILASACINVAVIFTYGNIIP